MRFRLLGPITACSDTGTVLTISPRERVVLATLLLDAGQLVPHTRLITAVWATGPPRTARDQLYTCVSRLRRLVREAGIADIATGAAGYRIEVESRSLDLHVFEEHLATAYAAQAQESWEQAVQAFRAAERLWRGPALDGADSDLLRADAAALEERRLCAIEDRYDLEAQNGRSDAIVADLTALVRQHPHRERLHVALGRALYLAGQRGEARAAPDQAHARLAGLGREPGEDLRHLHRMVLRDGPPTPTAPPSGDAFALAVRSHRLRLGLTQEQLAGKTGLSVRNIGKLETGRTTAPRTATVGLLAAVFGLTGTDRDRFHQTAAGTAEPFHPPQTAQRSQPAGQETPVPAQLPPDISCFAGREDQLHRLHQLLPAARAITIGGAAGVGKSTLAIHWGHQVRDRFPDGQLYLNLRGSAPPRAPVSTADAIRTLLEGLGLPPQRIPAGVQAQIGLYRSLLADRRVLILLDNARDPEQVRPLLPGTGGCVVVVTSRNQLTELVATEGAQPLLLDPLTAAEARRMLERRIGPDRVAAEPEAVDEIINRCERLPIALAVVAARAAACPHSPLRVIAADLSGSTDGRHGR